MFFARFYRVFKHVGQTLVYEIQLLLKHRGVGLCIMLETKVVHSVLKSSGKIFNSVQKFTMNTTYIRTM